ncbi:MAG: hypothetical protein RLY90_507 [Pseudomonadota bacterium]
MLKRKIYAGFVALLLCCANFSAAAQELGQGAVKLSETERARLQAILDEPVDANALNASKTILYRQKDLAAVKLGDVVKREENLREWAKFDASEGKWGLRGFLAGTEKRAEAYRLGAELIQTQKWPPDAIRLRLQVANDYLDDNNIKEASRLLSEAENIVKVELANMPQRGGVPFWSARARTEFYMSKSRFSMRIGKWQEGIENARVAVDKARELQRMINLAPNENAKTWTQNLVVYAMADLASQQTMAGMYADAEWTLRDAYNLAKEFGISENNLMGLYNRVADLYIANGHYQDAAIFSARSEKIVLDQGYQLGSPMWLFARNRSNAALVGADKWKDALESYNLIDQETERLGRPARSSQAAMRGMVYLKNGKQDKALRLLQGNLRWLADNFGPEHYFTSISRGMYAASLWKTGNNEQARAEFDYALKGMTAPESLTGDFVESAIQQKMKHFILQSYLQLLAQTASKEPKDAEIIFQVADQLNTSKVQQALAEAAVRSGVTIPGLSDIIRKEQDAKNEISSLTNYISGQSSEDEKKRNPQVVEQMRNRLREIEAQRKEYKAQIQKSYPEYFQLIQPKSPSIQDIAKQLQNDELFISIIPMEEKTYVWAIDAQGSVNFQTANLSESELKDLVGKVRKTLDVAGLGPRAPAFDVASGYKIYKEIFAPFDAQIKDKAHLIVSTSGVLAQLPFAVLPRQATATNVAWLLRDVAVSHVPTANGWLALKRLGKQAPASQALLAWGDPAFDPNEEKVAAAPTNSTVRSVAVARSQAEHERNIMDAATYVAYSKIPKLPETRDEVSELATILSADLKNDLILGHEATRASVLKQSSSGNLARKQVVVFATHGLLAGDLPNLNQPALAMAATKDPKESPLLTLEDVLGLKLNADWVVLSACNTAGADGRAEEAMSGLARGFFYAGSRSLLVTHWSVESESAMMLTTHTFAAYKKNPQMRRAEALRQAMLETMKTPRFSHPAYWAPYALVGEGGR